MKKKENDGARVDTKADFADSRTVPANTLPPEKCWACVHRGEVPGSAHSSCHHPATAEEFHDNAAAHAIGILGRQSGIMLIPSRAAVTLRITASTYGISRGWFIWPVNFDPTWLETCGGFTAKAEGR